MIEALIVVAIISILAAVAWPSYQTYVRRAERSKAQQLMLEIANREQQYIVDARAYTATIGSGGLNVPNKEGWTCSGLTCTGPRYTITVTVATPPPPGFTITATPTGQQAVDGTMTFNNIGAKTRVVGGVDRGWTGP